MQPIVYVLIFVATFMAAEGLLMLFGSRSSARRMRASRRLRRLASSLQAPNPGSGVTLLRTEKEGQAILNWIYRLIPAPRTVEMRLYRAGLATTPTRFVGFSVLLGLAGSVVGGVLWADVLVGVMFATTGLIPWLQAGRLERKRMRRFEEQFPEALELMTRAMRAGHSLTFAFQLVGEEMADPICVEFRHVSEEIKLGQDVRVALANLAYRINVGDLPYFITAVMVQRETGGNLAELLDNLGYVIRDRFKLFGKVRSLTAVGKVTANILGLWPLLMVALLYMVGADFVKLLWEDSTGQILGVFAVILVVVGYVGCRRAAEIKV